MQNRMFIGSIGLLIIGLASSITALGSELTVPNEFSSGGLTSAADMNANFTAVKSAVDDNNTRIAALEGRSQGAGARVVFQGFSAGTVDGAVGLIAMQQQCNDLVEGSHICTDGEVAKSPYNPAAMNLEGEAWVLREGGSVSYDGNIVMDTPLSLTNIQTSSNGFSQGFSCSGWSSNAPNSATRGSVVNSTGQIKRLGCDNQLKVACCK